MWEGMILLTLLALLFLATRCRRNHPGMADLRGWAYAHRGLHGQGIPENSMAAFRKALEQGYGVELDIHLLKDGTLAVIHDSQLSRTTGLPGQVEALTKEDLKQAFLEGTSETVPEFQEVLNLFNGKAPLIVELKPSGNNWAALTEAACKMLESYPGVYCLESFDPRCIRYLRRHRPELIRGQLSENFLKTGGHMPLLLKVCLTYNLLNFLTVPDFIAYRFDHRKDTFTNALCRKVWKAQGVSWTLRRREDYDTAVKEGWLPIFEGFSPEVPSRKTKA